EKPTHYKLKVPFCQEKSGSFHRNSQPKPLQKSIGPGRMCIFNHTMKGLPGGDEPGEKASDVEYRQ
ncbi:MAG TPA: hypothetical protein PKN59_07875, partial [Syntrophales bacterium]|nr:hypothetical protein [Syntrophales bacterium]